MLLVIPILLLFLLVIWRWSKKDAIKINEKKQSALEEYNKKVQEKLNKSLKKKK